MRTRFDVKGKEVVIREISAIVAVFCIVLARYAALTDDGPVALEQGTNQSVERAVEVLSAFVVGKPEMRGADIVRITGLGQSTVSRLLATMESLGLVARDPTSGLFRLGLQHLTFASVALNQHPVHRTGRQVAQNLACRLGLGVNIAVRDADTLFYLCNFDGMAAPRSYTLAGHRNPLHATGIGKCLLLGLDDAQRRELLGAELASYTTRTIASHDDLDAELARTEVRGYALEIEELARGRACIAAPIRDAQSDIVAAMSISGPLSAMDLTGREDELAGLVIEAADSIATGLGYVVTPGLHAVGMRTRGRTINTARAG
jgi:DNA-binding IclR family transcriptional regulator